MRIIRISIVVLAALGLSAFLWSSNIIGSNVKKPDYYTSVINGESIVLKQSGDDGNTNSSVGQRNNLSAVQQESSMLANASQLIDMKPSAVKNLSQEEIVDGLWNKYSTQLPKLYQGRYGRDANVPLPSEDFEKILVDGDLHRDTNKIINELRKETFSGLKDEDISNWKTRFNIVRENYIKLARSGDFYSAWFLGSEYIAHPIKDDSERLAWVLIAVAIGIQTNSMQVCDPSKFVCNEELLKESLDKALFYIDYYDFQLRKL